ncbi:hypothetical protein SDC9_79959 [bioreactor metagenome]|uniref:Uncharacterized protein n=1 Tax=bioreactor metagenome TaxID=1076179 RepID=A0A644YXR0_9ZZZZ
MGDYHACYHGCFLGFHDGYRFVGVEAEEVLSKIALAKVEIGIVGIVILQFVVYPVDRTGLVFYPFPCFGVVLHDLSGTSLSLDIDLPEYDFFLFRGSQGIVFRDVFYFFFWEVVAEKTHEVGIIGGGLLYIFVGYRVHYYRSCRYCSVLGGLGRLMLRGFGLRQLFVGRPIGMVIEELPRRVVVPAFYFTVTFADGRMNGL